MAVKNLDQLFASSPSPTILTTALFLLRMAGVDYACTGENMVSLTMVNGSLRRLLKIPDWEAGSYDKGNFVIHDEQVCASLVDGNVAEPAGGSNENWEVHDNDLELLESIFRALI